MSDSNKYSGSGASHGSRDARRRVTAPATVPGNNPNWTADPLVTGMRRLDWRAYWQTFRGESFAFKMACFYLFIEYVRPQSIWPAIDILPLGLLSLCGSFVIVLASRAERSPRTYGSQWPLLLWMFALILVSILASQYPQVGFGNLSLFVSWLIAYYVITKTVNNERRYLFFFVLFLLFSFKMSQHGFKSWAQSGFRFNREGVVGAPGWFHNSGEVGIQMCIFLPMMLHFAIAGWANWDWKRRAAIAVVIATIIGTIVGSSSRGALIGSSVALFWMLLRSRYKFRGLIWLGIFAAIIVLALPAEFTARLDSMGQDNSSKLRLEYWSYGWEMMKQHPLLGIGYFNWYPTYSAHLLAIGSSRKAEVCHNIFIQAGSELGFGGVFLVLALIIATFVLNARTRRLLAQQPDGAFLRSLTLGLDAGMIGYVVSAQFVTVLYYPYLWIAIALTVAMHNTVRRRLPLNPSQ